MRSSKTEGEEEEEEEEEGGGGEPPLPLLPPPPCPPSVEDTPVPFPVLFLAGTWAASPKE